MWFAGMILGRVIISGHYSWIWYLNMVGALRNDAQRGRDLLLMANARSVEITFTIYGLWCVSGSRDFLGNGV